MNAWSSRQRPELLGPDERCPGPSSGALQRRTPSLAHASAAARASRQWRRLLLDAEARVARAAPRVVAIFPSGGAAPRAAGRLPAAAGCAERTVRRSPAVTAAWPTQLLQPWQTSSPTPYESNSAASDVEPRAVRLAHHPGHAAVRRARHGNWGRGFAMAPRAAAVFAKPVGFQPARADGDGRFRGFRRRNATGVRHALLRRARPILRAKGASVGRASVLAGALGAEAFYVVSSRS